MKTRHSNFRCAIEINPAYLPARDLESISLQELIDTVRQVNRDTSAVAIHLVPLPEVDRVMDKMDAAIAESLGEKTLKDLVRAARSIQR